MVIDRLVKIKDFSGLGEVFSFCTLLFLDKTVNLSVPKYRPIHCLYYRIWRNPKRMMEKVRCYYAKVMPSSVEG